jgi:hypothetical protein
LHSPFLLPEEQVWYSRRRVESDGAHAWYREYKAWGWRERKGSQRRRGEERREGKKNSGPLSNLKRLREGTSYLMWGTINK